MGQHIQGIQQIEFAESAGTEFRELGQPQAGQVIQGIQQI